MQLMPTTLSRKKIERKSNIVESSDLFYYNGMIEGLVKDILKFTDI